MAGFFMLLPRRRSTPLFVLYANHMKENRFLKLYATKSTAELKNMVANPKLFQKEAVAAAIELLESRDVHTEEAERFKAQSEQRVVEIEEDYMALIGLPTNTASFTSRFLNALIDGLIFYGVNYVVFLLPLGSLSTVLALLIVPVYYIVMEFRFQQTIGKMATNTKVIDPHGNPPSLSSIVIRTLVRYVPFEFLTFIDSPICGWQDKWSKTYVVKVQDIAEIQEKMAQINEAPAAS